MRKILLLTVCCALVCSLSGCIVFRRGSSNEYRSDEELANEMIENIIDCAEKEDAKALTELFSQYAEDSTLNLAEQAEEFIEFFQGQCKSWKGNASSHEKSEYGKTIWRELRGQYSVITDEAQYKIAYIYIPFHREEPDKAGLTAIEITTEETFNKDWFLWSLDQKPGIYVTEDKEEMLSEQRLITSEELIRAAGLTKEQYRGADLEQFIEDFAITEEDVDTLNIPLLLEEYEPDRKDILRDVSYILEDGIENRTSGFTENVTAIAFMENKNTSTECVYYDLPDRKRYQTSDAYLFDDLYQTEPEYYADGQQMVEALDKYGVFSWESKTDEEEITDPQYMVLAVEYEDGTVFRVKASGLLSQVLPDEYDEVREMLLSGEYSGS
ncbi:DUF5104 domain-containing protein [Mediterraneibacter glycyrrhizinilyticus]|uniref:DUF5104 domain-containing protein n=1 Tax=Mediterraneibacter glycyrrhizinilyticus TaxID=342942 RepID=UPI0025AA826F|nr:DUF5104 domain-containing protein [Mediterraneibacter glycyrrhizinilyticus]MDN0060160.1 DUF5104 domain-containing protein [Mediterraneibacter glycyrrhizinilyticus]